VYSSDVQKSELKIQVLNRVLVVASLLVVAACSGADESESRQRNAALPVANKRVGVIIKSVSAGGEHSLALDENGQLYAWGNNRDDQATVPALLKGVKVVAVSAGAGQSLALDEKGRVHAWGRNTTDQGVVPESLKSVKVAAVSAGLFHNVALDEKGRVYTWGNTAHATVPAPLKDVNVVAVSAGWAHSLALDEKGRLYAWGNDNNGQATVPAPLKDVKVVAVSAGLLHSLALDENGRVHAWGNDNNGQATVPAPLKDVKVVAVSAGEFHSLALDEKGQVYAWGWNIAGQGAVPKSLNGVKAVAVSAGATHNVAVDENGQVYAWGWNFRGQSTVPPVLSGSYARTMPIAMGGTASLGIDDTGATVIFSGKSLYGGLSTLGLNHVSVAAGPRHVLAVTTSGTVEAFGEYFAGQTAVPTDLNGVVQVVAGYAYSAALRHDGRVVEWGSHTAPSGKLISKPDDLPRVKHLAGGLTHIVGITTDGKVVSWGNNAYGQAAPPDGLDKVIDVAANAYCSAALRENGDIVYWGTCHYALTSKESLRGATRIAMSANSAAAIVDGSITAWGDDFDGTLTVPQENSFVALAAGSGAFMAVKENGDVVAWGNNGGEKFTIPESFGGAPPVVNDEICVDCQDQDPVVINDETLKANAGFIVNLLTREQLALFIEALGGSTTKPLTPLEIQALVDAATAAERANARRVAADAVVAGNASSQSVAKVLPASQSPLTKVGAVVSTRRAVQLLGLKKVSKVSFVVPKKSLPACRVTVRSVRATKVGSCDVKVRYTDAKKKTRSTTLTLVVG